MPRRVPTQVPQTVSRLLEAGFLKRPPAWFDAVNQHPSAPVPARQVVPRPDEDLPRSLRSSRQQPVASTSNKDIRNMKKKVRSQGPQLNPKPIVYDEDSVRKQFFRDHPWEAYRPKTLVETSAMVGTETRYKGDPKRLKSYGRNPSVEDFVACTLEAHRNGGLSLSQAYHNTLSSFYALKAEREHATRYAILEAKSYGANLGKSETQRGFEKEEKTLESWAAWAAGSTSADAESAQKVKAPRVKRTDDTFTGGNAYLEAAQAFRDGKADLASFAGSSTFAHDVASASAAAEQDPLEDFLGLRSREKPTASPEAPTPSADGEQSTETDDEQRFRKRLGTRGQRI